MSPPFCVPHVRDWKPGVSWALKLEAIRASIIQGSLEVKLLTYGQMLQQRREESEEIQAEEKKPQKRKSQEKEDQSARKGRKVAKGFDLPPQRGSGGSKSIGLPKQRMRDQKSAQRLTKFKAYALVTPQKLDGCMWRWPWRWVWRIRVSWQLIWRRGRWWGWRSVKVSAATK